MAEIVANSKGKKVVEIDMVVFSSKRRINWAGVEEYLKRYVGQRYPIDETEDLIYIDSDFPDEYISLFVTLPKSKWIVKCHGKNRYTFRRKRDAAGIPFITGQVMTGFKNACYRKPACQPIYSYRMNP